MKFEPNDGVVAVALTDGGLAVALKLFWKVNFSHIVRGAKNSLRVRSGIVSNPSMR